MVNPIGGFLKWGYPTGKIPWFEMDDWGNPYDSGNHQWLTSMDRWGFPWHQCIDHGKIMGESLVKVAFFCFFSVFCGWKRITPQCFWGNHPHSCHSWPSWTTAQVSSGFSARAPTRLPNFEGTSRANGRHAKSSQRSPSQTRSGICGGINWAIHSGWMVSGKTRLKCMIWR